jgi:hypothetical protein
MKLNTSDAEKYYRYIISTIAVNITAAFIFAGAVPEYIIIAMYVPFLAVYSVFSFRLAKILGKPPVLWAILTATPLLSFVAILILLNKCRRQLKENGINIRFFGGY